MKTSIDEANEALKRAARILKCDNSTVGIKNANHINMCDYNLTDLIAALADRIESLERQVSQQR